MCSQNPSLMSANASNSTSIELPSVDQSEPQMEQAVSSAEKVYQIDGRLERLRALVCAWEKNELLWATDKEELLDIAVRVNIANHHKLSDLRKLIRSLCTFPTAVNETKLDQLLPDESTLVDHYVRPQVDAALAAIRRQLADHKCFVSMSSSSLGPGLSVVSFVMIGTLLEDKAGDLYMINAVDLQQNGTTFEQLLLESLKRLWPKNFEKHAANILLCVTDDPAEIVSFEELSDIFPKMVIVNGYEKMLTSLVQEYDAEFVSNNKRPEDGYFYQLRDSTLEALEAIRARQPLNTVIEAIEEVWAIFENWSNSSGTDVTFTEAWARNVLAFDYEALVRISEEIFQTEHESSMLSELPFDVNVLTPAEKELFRFAPLGGINCARYFPRFEAVLADFIEYLPLYSVLYCNEASLVISQRM